MGRGEADLEVKVRRTLRQRFKSCVYSRRTPRVASSHQQPGERRGAASASQPPGGAALHLGHLSFRTGAG